MGIIVTLPWPDKRLSPNARIHWRRVVDVKAAAREDAAKATYAACPRGMRETRAALAGDGLIPVKITFFPPDRRHRDDDNMIGSMKAARDGIADALGVNDRRFRADYAVADPDKPGRVVVEIMP